MGSASLEHARIGLSSSIPCSGAVRRILDSVMKINSFMGYKFLSLIIASVKRPRTHSVQEIIANEVADTSDKIASNNPGISIDSPRRSCNRRTGLGKEREIAF